ncbi:hypothetical protein BC832DRAFT_548913 [Gaertneriomyces semiglobifer]|nr:hypothetical protein BC832DRAFT_548913 [Gaertneriomyces semiglobifer]
MAGVNLYSKRTATKEAPCFICSKFTTTVLSNTTADWFYVCQGHIDDPSFCHIPDRTVPEAPSAVAAQPQPPTPITYELASNIFYLRENYHKQKANRQTARAIASQMPSVPRSALP